MHTRVRAESVVLPAQRSAFREAETYSGPVDSKKSAIHGIAQI